MSDEEGHFLVIAVNWIGGSIASIPYSYQKGLSNRIPALGAWAYGQGLSVNINQDSSGVHHLMDFDSLCRGDTHYFEFQASGVIGETPFLIFEMAYEPHGLMESEEKFYTERSMCGCVLSLPFSFKGKVRVRPTSSFDKVKSGVGLEDINFESDAFSRQYHVSASSRKLAYSLITPQIMEALMEIKGYQIEFGERGMLIRPKRWCLREKDCADLLRVAQAVAQKLPRILYVADDAG